MSATATSGRGGPSTRARRIPALLTAVGLLVVAALFFFPMVWMVMSSFKSNRKVQRSPTP